MKSLQGILMVPDASLYGFGLMIAFLSLFLTVVIPSSARAQNVDPKKPAIVLVHGASANRTHPRHFRRWSVALGRASGEPLIINKLPPGLHKILIELVNANHQTLDRGVVNFVVPQL